jgi:hypothetical protein
MAQNKSLAKARRQSDERLAAWHLKRQRLAKKQAKMDERDQTTRTDAAHEREAN